MLCAEQVAHEKPQIVWFDVSGSSQSYGRASQRRRCGVSPATRPCRVIQGLPNNRSRSSAIWATLRLSSSISRGSRSASNTRMAELWLTS